MFYVVGYVVSYIRGRLDGKSSTAEEPPAPQVDPHSTIIVQPHAERHIYLVFP